jgi:hypothetical protein
LKASGVHAEARGINGLKPAALTERFRERFLNQQFSGTSGSIVNFERKRANFSIRAGDRDCLEPIRETSREQ